MQLSITERRSPIAMPFRLRAYDPSDFETLYTIDRACYPRGIAYSRTTLHWFLAQPGAECLVSEAAGAIVGFLISESEAAEAHLITLDVVAEQRRTGVGSALLHAAEEQLAARGVRRVGLETATSNEAGVAFWQRHGYRTLGVLPNYYLGRLNAFAMQKHLAPPSEA